MGDRLFLPEDGVDEECSLAILDNSMDFYILVLKTFVKEATKIKNEMQQYREESNMPQYQVTVHGLKSSAKSVGFMDLSELAKESEYLCKNSNWDGAMKKYEDLIDELECATDLINRRISERDERLSK